VPKLLQDLELFERQFIIVQGYIVEICYNGPFFQAIYETGKKSFDIYDLTFHRFLFS
jgi:hypothetical protein